MDTDNNNLPSDNLPSDLAACHALIAQERARMQELSSEMEKLRKLLSRLVNGSRSEKRVNVGQACFLYESEEEFQAAKTEAETKAKRSLTVRSSNMSAEEASQRVTTG